MTFEDFKKTINDYIGTCYVLYSNGDCSLKVETSVRCGRDDNLIYPIVIINRQSFDTYQDEYSIRISIHEFCRCTSIENREKILECISEFEHIYSISFYDNEGWYELPHGVKYIDIDSFDISALCKGKGLSNVKILDLLGSNESVKKVIKHVKSIEKLVINSNQFKYCLPEIIQLQQLSSLHINGTLNEIPDWLINQVESKKITELSVYSTVFEELPPEIKKQSGIEKIRYYLELQRGRANNTLVPLHESKLIIVGQGDVGKTSVLNRIVYNKYDANSETTEGIDINKWTFLKNDVEYSLNIWDLGGQEIYHSTHQFFLSKRSLYLLVWNAREEESAARIDYWMQTIQSIAGDSPVIMVMNHCDEGKRITPIDIGKYVSKYPQIIDCFRLSCRDGGKPVEELREKIVSTSIQLPLMDEQWSEARWSVRKQLEKISEEKDIIPFSEFVSICSKFGLTDETDQASLAKQLNDLGQIIYFEDERYPELSSQMILSPDWGTNAVYGIIDAQEKTLKGKNGVLDNSDLPKIWDSSKYPKSVYSYLLSLMDKFELSFALGDGKRLVPELLPAIPVKEVNIPSGEKVRFNYNYTGVLPAGVMTRFIAKANGLLVELEDGIKACWREGAYLERNGIYALVEIDKQNGTGVIKITVMGGDRDTRAQMLTIMRSYIEDINYDYSKLDLRKTVPCCCDDGCMNEYDYDVLLLQLEQNMPQVICIKSKKKVSVEKLLYGIDKKCDATINMISESKASDEDKNRAAQMMWRQLTSGNYDGTIIPAVHMLIVEGDMIMKHNSVGSIESNNAPIVMDTMIEDGAAIVGGKNNKIQTGISSKELNTLLSNVKNINDDQIKNVLEILTVWGNECDSKKIKALCDKLEKNQSKGERFLSILKRGLKGLASVADFALKAAEIAVALGLKLG